MGDIRHAARDNGLGYWSALTRNTIRYYVRHRRWRALARALWLTAGRGYYLEVCELCGRKVGCVWHAEDGLYQVMGAKHGGMFCTACFETAAERDTDGVVVWVPIVTSRQGGDSWRELLRPGLEALLTEPERPA